MLSSIYAAVVSRLFARAFRQDRRNETAYKVSLFAILLFGLVLRLRGQLGEVPSLWLDEAAWATMLIGFPVFELSFRPIGFMWAVKQLVGLFGATEFWLRFISNAASIVSLALVPSVASQLIQSRAVRLLAVFLFALHPALIDLAKEFKPYSLEVFVHLLPLFLYLRFRETRQAGYFYALLAVLPVLFVFAYNIAFAYPAVLLVALHTGVREFGRKAAVLCVASGAASLLLSLGIFVTLLGGTTGDRAASAWGRKYDVFYTGQLRTSRPPRVTHAGIKVEDDRSTSPRAVSRLGWTVRKYVDVAALPNLRRQLWTARPGVVDEDILRALRRVDKILWLALHLFGLGFLVYRRRYADLLLLLGPLACVLLANVLKVWPFGAFRTNLFLCVHAILLACVGVDASFRRNAWRTMLGVPIGLTLTAGLLFGFDFHRYKRMWTRHPDEIRILAVLTGARERRVAKHGELPPERVFLDMYTARMHNFYLNYHPSVRQRYRQYFETHFEQPDLDDFKIYPAIREELTSATRPFWVVVTYEHDMEPIGRLVHSQGIVLLEARIRDEHRIWYVAPRPRRDRVEHVAGGGLKPR